MQSKKPGAIAGLCVSIGKLARASAIAANLLGWLSRGARLDFRGRLHDDCEEIAQHGEARPLEVRR